VPDARPNTPPPSTDDVDYRLLKLLAEQPDASQRQLAEALGISLGKANYCIKALLDKGWVKARNFKNSKHKLAYAYVLTPSGLDAKARITARFLKRKVAEDEALKAEIEQPRRAATPCRRSVRIANSVRHQPLAAALTEA
jgi:EPS-associated MarR family transcriptional regulator